MDLNMQSSAMDYKTAMERLKAAGFYTKEGRGFYSHFVYVRNGPPSPENNILATFDIEDGKVDGYAVESLILNRKMSGVEAP